MKNNKKYILALCISLCLSMITGGVKKESNTIWESKDELVFGTTLSTKSLDPAQAYNGWFTVRYGIAETLFKLDEKMEPIPWLAEKYELIDAYNWKITIKENIYFQNGIKMTAEKVKDSLERTLEINSRAKSTLKISSIRVDGDAIIVTTQEENPTLINDLCDPFAAIIDVEGNSDFDNSPIGTGPFKVEEFSSISSSYLVKNDNYWDGKVKLSKLKIIPISDSDTLAMALQSGEIDIAQGISSSLTSLLSKDSEYKVNSIETSRVIAMYFNDNNVNLSDNKVRKAINMLIDKETYSNVLLNGSASATIGPFPSNTAYGANIQAVSSFNKELANKILKEEGYSDIDGDGILDKNGEKLSLKLVAYSARAELPTIAQAVQADLKEAGIEVNIEIVENIYTILEEGNFDLCLYSNLTSSSGDPLAYLNNAMRTNGEMNYGHYSNSEIDQLLNEMQMEFNNDKRDILAQEIVQKAINDDAYNYICHSKVSFVMKNNVVGFEAHPTDYYQFNKDTYIQ